MTNCVPSALKTNKVLNAQQTLIRYYRISMRDICVHFDPGKKGNGIVAILQNPGLVEAQAKPYPHPAAGDTGEHLGRVLAGIREKGNGEGRKGLAGCRINEFFYDRKKTCQGIMIVNSYPEVYCGKKEMPTSTDENIHMEKGNPPLLLSCEHMRFVAEKIAQKKLVLCFGERAKMCYFRIINAPCTSKLQDGHKVVMCCHLSPCAINTRVFYNADGSPAKTEEQKLSVIADYIYGSLTDECQCEFCEFLQQRACKKCVRFRQGVT